MATRTLPALARALERAGLTAFATSAGVRVSLCADRNGVLHKTYCSVVYPGGHLGPTEPVVAVPLADLLRGTRAVCEGCGHQMAGLYGDDTLVLLGRLLELAELSRSAHRLVAKPAGRTAGKATKLQKRLAEMTAMVERTPVTGMPAAAGDAVTAVTAQARAAGAALRHAGKDPDVVAALCARVVEELVPARYRAHVTLEDDAVLIGITPPGHPPRRVQEVIDTFEVARTGAGVALLAPRYVVDYLNRFYAAGTGWGSVAVVTAAASHLSTEQAHNAAAMWRPGTAAPMADLATCVQAVHLLAVT